MPHMVRRVTWPRSASGMKMKMVPRMPSRNPAQDSATLAAWLPACSDVMMYGVSANV